MKNLLKPSLRKIILFVLLFVIFFFLWNIYQIITQSPTCMGLPQLPINPQPSTLQNIIHQIPNAITGNYDHCSYASASLISAISIVNYSSIVIITILSYILSCYLVSLFTKLKNRNTKKK